MFNRKQFYTVVVRYPSYLSVSRERLPATRAYELANYLTKESFLGNVIEFRVIPDDMADPLPDNLRVVIDPLYGRGMAIVPSTIEDGALMVA